MAGALSRPLAGFVSLRCRSRPEGKGTGVQASRWTGPPEAVFLSRTRSRLERPPALSGGWQERGGRVPAPVRSGARPYPREGPPSGRGRSSKRGARLCPARARREGLRGAVCPGRAVPACTWHRSGFDPRVGRSRPGWTPEPLAAQNVL